MEVVKFWEIDNKKSKYVNLDVLLNYIKEHKKDRLNVTNNKVLQEKLNSDEMDVYFFDEQHGCFIKNFDFNFISDIYVSEEFYETNKGAIQGVLQEVLFASEVPYISKEVYDESFIKSLVLVADKIQFAPDVNPSEEVISFLSENHIAAYKKEGKETVELTRCNYLGQDYKNLVSDSKFFQVEDTITDYENLKLIAPHKNIKIARNTFRAIEDYDNVYKIISTIRENGQDNYVAIELNIDDKENFKNSKLYKSDLKYNISGIELMTDYDHEEYRKQEELLDLIASDIKNSDFSPLEKYIAVYNIAKKFKEYKEDETNLAASRYFKEFMNNEYMVCVGFAKLLADLCERVGIDTYDYSLKVDVSYDKGFSKEEKVVDLARHARIIVNIKDPKYGVDGYYVADPTWDNVLEYDLYNYALMSFDKTAQNKRYVNLTTEDLLMNVNSIEEYVEKVNFLLSRTKDKTELSSVKSRILKILKPLYPEVYQELKEKYPDIETTYDPNVIQTIIMEAGYLFVEKNGKDIPLETIIDAASVVNDKVFGFNEEQSKEYKEKLYELNLQRDKDAFPYYYEENKHL